MVKKDTISSNLKVLVIPDVHLKTEVFDRADKILASEQADYAVCLGDYFDDWDCEFNEAKYKAMADRIRKFSFDHKDTVWLIGNHDFAYLHPECSCSGHSVYMEEIVRNCLTLLKNTVCEPKILVRIGRVLFSHAGLSEQFVKEHMSKEYNILEKALEDPKPAKFFKESPGEKFIDSILPQINSLAWNSESRILWQDTSPLWIRPQLNTSIPMFGCGFVQVIGHTPTKKVQSWDNMITCDEFSTESSFPYKPWGEEKFIIVDCRLGSWEYARED